MTAHYGADYLSGRAAESHYHSDLDHGIRDVRGHVSALYTELADTQQQVSDLKREVRDLAKKVRAAGVTA